MGCPNPALFRPCLTMNITLFYFVTESYGIGRNSGTNIASYFDGAEPAYQMKADAHQFQGRDMKKEQQGFTLIELMIVVAIIGILAAIAIPAYQNYIIRAQISEGLTLSAGAKTAVSEYFMDRGDWPADNDEAGLADKHDIIGNYTEHIEVEDNVIEIKFGYDAHPNIMDEKIELIAVNNAGSISWTCASVGTIQAKHLPAACR